MRKNMVLVLVVSMGIAMAQWQPSVRLTNTSGSSYTTYSGGWAVTADPLGGVHVTWYDYTTSQRIRYYYRDPSGTWSPSIPGSGDAVSTTYGYHPSVAADGSGNAQVVWYYYSYPYIHFREKSGGTWGTITRFGGSSSYYPAVWVDGNDNVHVVWYHYRYYSSSRYGYQIWYRQRTGSWGSEELVQDVNGRSQWYYHPSVTVDGSGIVHVVYTRSWYYGSPRYSLWYNNNASGWGSALMLSDDAYPWSGPSICVDPADNIHVVYTGYSSRQIYYTYSTDGGTTWSTPVNISNSSGSCYDPSICADPMGNIHVVWEDYRDGNWEIYYSKFDGTSWSTPENLSQTDDGSYNPSIASDDNGNLHVVWCEFVSGNYEIYYKEYIATPSGGRDVAMERILAPKGNIPKLAVTPEGVVKNYGSSDEEVYAECWITGPGSDYHEYNKEGPITIPAGGEDNVTFPDWTPPGEPGDEYRVKMRVRLYDGSEDDNPNNDVQIEYCIIVAGHDIKPLEAIEPSEGEYNAGEEVPVVAVFYNNGVEDETNVPVGYDVIKDGSVIHSETATLDAISSGAQDTVEFTSWTPEEGGDYTIAIYSALANDEIPDNDTITVNITVTGTGIYTEDKESTSELCVKVEHGAMYINTCEENALVKIFDITGSVVRRCKVTANNTTVVKGLVPGVYFVKLLTPEHTIVKKVILF